MLWFAYFLVSSISGLKVFQLHYLCGHSDLEPSVQLFFGLSQPCLCFKLYVDPTQMNSIPELGALGPCMLFP